MNDITSSPSNRRSHWRSMWRRLLPLVVVVTVLVAGINVPSHATANGGNNAAGNGHCGFAMFPEVVFVSQTTTEVSGPSNSDGDGFFEPCETLQSDITVMNVGDTETPVSVLFSTVTPNVTIVGDVEKLIDSLAPGQSANIQFTFKLEPTFTPGTTIEVYLFISYTLPTAGKSAKNIFANGPVSRLSGPTYTVPTGCPLTPGGTPDCTTTACGASAVLQNCRVSLGITGQTLLGNTCGPPNYAGDLVLTAVLTNTSTQTISDVFVQVVGLGYPDSTPTGVIVATPNPHRLLTADGATCSSGGQAGANQSTVDGTTPIGTLNPGESRTLTFRIALPAIRRLRFFVNVFGVGGTACPVALNEGQAPGLVMATTVPLKGTGFGFELLQDKGRLTVAPLTSGTAIPGTRFGRRR